MEPIKSQDVRLSLSPVWSHYTDIIAARGEGCWIYSEDGKKYLDFTCGIGVTNTGHCHPRVVAAIREQAGLLIHGQANIIYHRPMLDLVQELKRIVPPSLDSFFFSNSGAEAVEGAVKLARHATRKQNVIVFQGSFHGRTVGAMALTTSKRVYRSGYQPLMPGVCVAPYPYAYRFGWDDEQTTRWCLDELDLLLHSQTGPEETAAVLIEPVLGEGGYVVPAQGFLKELREICNRNGILMILDEIQTGFGRTARWFAQEHFDIVPDIMTIAKGLASGLPISGVVSRMDLMKKWTTGSHGGTYGGNAIAAAAAVATIRAIRDEHMIENASARGDELLRALKALQANYPILGDVRGLGLMIGIELRTHDHKPDKALAKEIVHKCLDKGLILITCGTWDNVIRMIPPLMVSPSEISEAIRIFKEALEETID